MPTKKAVFEVATLADAVKRAARMAPTKGAAFDRAAGIVLTVDPNADEPAVIMSTDLEVSYRQSVNVISVSEPARWRLPSQLWNSMMGTFPMGIGSTVRLGDNGDGNLYFHVNKTKAKLRLILGEYPDVLPFDPANLAVVPGFAKRLTQVSWATADRGVPLLTGVHIDGDYLIATDKASLACVPCVVPVDRPVTAPLSELAFMLRDTVDVRLRAAADHMEIMPDDHTQVKSVLYAEKYPNARLVLDRGGQDQAFGFDAETMVQALDRVLVLCKSEQYPVTSFEIGTDTLSLVVDVPEVGKVLDEIEIVGGVTAGEPVFKMTFSPHVFKQCITGSGRPTLKFNYGPTALSPVIITDDNEYKALMMPRSGGGQ